MKHYGPEPPWRSEGRYGRWVWRAPNPESWLDEPGYWELVTSRSPLAIVMEGITKDYMAALNRTMYGDVLLAELLP